MNANIAKQTAANSSQADGDIPILYTKNPNPAGTDSAALDELFVSPQIPVQEFAVADAPKGIQVVLHPLFEICAVMTTNSLTILSSRHLRLIQRLIDPLAPRYNQMDTMASSLQLPFRLQDSDILFASKETRISSAERKVLPPRLITSSWHRESLTLAVGTTHSIFIFAGFNTAKANTPQIRFECARFIRVDWPCTFLFWLNDCLLTKSCSSASPENLKRYGSEAQKSLRLASKTYTNGTAEPTILPSSQFFVWNCEFRRYTAKPWIDYDGLNTNETNTAAHKLTLAVMSCSPVLRDNWDWDNTALAEFLSCSDSPIFCWTALAGFNARPAPPIPTPIPVKALSSTDPNERDQITMQVRRICAHPCARFIAALYGISINAVTPVAVATSKSDAGKARTALLQTTTNVVPSPVVRIWSLRPNFGGRSLDESDQRRVKNRGHVLNASDDWSHGDGVLKGAPTVRKRRFLNLGAKSEAIVAKGRSCFLSGVSGLFHMARTRQKQVQGADDEGGKTAMQAPSPTSEFQGPEWLIVDQLHRLSSESLPWRGNSTLPISATPNMIDHKRVLMALMASRGLVSDTDLVTFYTATQGFHSIGGSSTMTRHESLFEDTLPQLRQRISTLNDDICLAAIPGIVDGPYYCCSLNHKAPVLEISWRDDGPTMDEVFIPSVLCSLTVDNCITIWVESQTDTYLWFEAVILLRLEISPLRNFFHPMDLVPGRPRTMSSTSAAYGTTTPKTLLRRYAPTITEQSTLSDIDILSQAGLATTTFDEASVTFCWLTAHRISPMNMFTGNILRLIKAETKSRLMALEILEETSIENTMSTQKHVFQKNVLPISSNANVSRYIGNRRNILPKYSTSASDIENPLISDTTDKDLDAPLISHAGAVSSDTGVLPFRCSGHVSDPSHAVVPGVIKDPGVSLATLMPIPALPAQPLPALATLSHRQHSIDFLLLTEAMKGTHGTSILHATALSGLWVYTLRELGSQPRGNPAVKRLLEPHQLPFPCKVRTLVSAEAVKSLGLSDGLWGDECAAVVGYPITIRDGILLPSCIVTAVTEAGELISCLIRPRAASPEELMKASATSSTARSTSDVSFTVVYEARIEKRFGPSISPFHVLKTRELSNLPRGAFPLSSSSSTSVAGSNLSSVTDPKATPRFKSSIAFENSQSLRRPHALSSIVTPTPTDRTLSTTISSPLCRLKAPYWKLLEQHPLLPTHLLALNNRGWLFVANTSDHDVDTFEERDCTVPFICPGDDVKFRKEFVYVCDTDRTNTGPLLRGESQEQPESVKTENPRLSTVDFAAFSKHQQYSVKALSESSMCCIHSLGGTWVDKDVHVWCPNESCCSAVTSKHLFFGHSMCEAAPPLPSMRHAIWLPLQSRPPIVLGVTEPGGHLLCLEVSHWPGTSVTIRGIPFFGSYCGSFLDVQLLVPSSAYTDKHLVDSGGIATGNTNYNNETLNSSEHNAVVSYIAAEPRSENECLLLIRVTLEASPASLEPSLLEGDNNKEQPAARQTSTSPLREEHVILLRCQEVFMEDQNKKDSQALKSRHHEHQNQCTHMPSYVKHNELKTPVSRTALHVDMIYEGFMDFSAHSINLSGLTMKDALQEQQQCLRSQSSQDFSNANLDIEKKSIISEKVVPLALNQDPKNSNIIVAPHLALTTTYSHGGILGLMASYPPLELGTDGNLLPEQQTKHIETCRPPHIDDHSIIGIYEILERPQNSIQLFAWAPVLTRHQVIGHQKTILIDDPIVALSLTHDWLGVITANGKLHLYSLLDVPPLTSLSSLPRIFHWASVSLGIHSILEPLPPASIPILSVTESISLRSTLDVLQSEALVKRRIAEEHLHNIIGLYKKLYPSTLRTQPLSASEFGSGPQQQSYYFKKTRTLFDSKLQLGTARRQSQPTNEPPFSLESTVVTKKMRKDLFVLNSECLGQPPILSFRRTHGDGLCLLVSLSCSAEMSNIKNSISSLNSSLRVIQMTDSTELELPPHIASLIFVRFRKEGVESWWKPRESLIACKEDVFANTAVWSASGEDLIVSTSVASRCLMDACLPPLVCKLSRPLTLLCQTVAAPRPIYHPASLMALVVRSDDLSLVLKILRRLISLLTTWRKTGSPISPTMDLPISMLCTKSTDWLQPEVSDSHFRKDFIANVLSVMTNGVEDIPASTEADTEAENLSEFDDSSSRLDRCPSIKDGSMKKTTRQHSSFKASHVQKESILEIKSAETFSGGSGKPETAAALFEADENFDFGLDLESDSDSVSRGRRQTQLETDIKKNPSLDNLTEDKYPTTPTLSSRKKKPRHTSDMSEFEEMIVRQETAQIVALKLLRESFGALESEEDEDLPSYMPEATKHELEELQDMFNLKNADNVEWLRSYGTLCPHLSLYEIAQLNGFIEVLTDLFDAFISARNSLSHTPEEGRTASTRHPPLFAAVWTDKEAGETHESIDFAGGKFLFAYHRVLTTAAAQLSLTKAVLSYSQQSEQQHVLSGLVSNVSKQSISIPLVNQPDWIALFPGGLRSSSSLGGDANIIEAVPISPYNTATSLNATSHLCLTTSDLCWAVQCQSDDLLLRRVLSLWRRIATQTTTDSTETAVTPRLSWAVLRNAGVGFWLRNPTIAMQLAAEDLPRDIYASQPADMKNPDAVALWYIATGRTAVLRALYKSVKNTKVVDFLSRDPQDSKTRLAGTKNAYALVRQRRYELAVAFFIFSGSYTEAMDVCCRQLDDPQLALFLAVLLEYRERCTAAGQDSPSPASEGQLSASELRQFVLSNRLLPNAIRTRDRWLESLICWLLSHYEHSVIATLTPELKVVSQINSQQLQQMTSTPKMNSPQNLRDSIPNADSSAMKINSVIWSCPGKDSKTLLSFESFAKSTAHHRCLSVFHHQDNGATVSVEPEDVYFNNQSIRYTAPNVSVARFRRHLLRTVQLRRSLQDKSVIVDFLQVVKNLDNYYSNKSQESIESINMLNKSLSHDCSKEQPENIQNGDSVLVSPAALVALVTICEDVMVLSDIGEALLYCLGNRLPFQGLQNLYDFRILSSSIFPTEGRQLRALSKSNIGIVKSLSKQHMPIAPVSTANLRLRWTAAFAFVKPLCEVLSYLATVNLKRAEADVAWMDDLLQHTVDLFLSSSMNHTPEIQTKPHESTALLHCASASWKQVITTYGSEPYSRGENLSQWILRQIEGPVDFQILTVGLPRHNSLIEKHSSDNTSAKSPLGEEANINKKLSSPMQAMENLEGLNEKLSVADAFSCALHGLPSWSRLSAAQDWTETAIFNGLTTAALNLTVCISRILYSSELLTSVQPMIAKALALQTAIRVAIAWCNREEQHLEQLLPAQVARFKILLSIAVAASCCVACIGGRVALDKVIRQSSTYGTEEDNPYFYGQFNSMFSSAGPRQQSSFWKQWPLNVDASILWIVLSLLVRYTDRLEFIYNEAVTSWLDTGCSQEETSPTSLKNLTTELVAFNSFLLNALLIPRVDYVCAAAENSELFTNLPQDILDKSVNQPTATVALGNLTKFPGALLTAGNDQFSQLLAVKSNIAKDVIFESLTADPLNKNSMRSIIFGTVRTSLKGHLLNTMSLILDSSEWWLSTIDTTSIPVSWQTTATYVIHNIKYLSSELSTYVFSDAATEYYTSLLSSVATRFPFLPMTLCSSAVFSSSTKDTTNASAKAGIQTDGVRELKEIDTTLIHLSIAAGCQGASSIGFQSLWSTLGCSRKLQLLLTRGPLSAVPASLSPVSIAPDQLPVYSRIITCVKDAPISIAIDRSGSLANVHHIPLVGPLSTPGLPLGLGFCNNLAINSSCYSGLGMLNLSTSQCVWEVNIAHSAIFNKHFGTASFLQPGIIAALGFLDSTSGSSRPDSAATTSGIASTRQSVAAIQGPMGHPTQVLELQTKNCLPGTYDDDDAQAPTLMGRLRCYDTVAELYEKQVAEQAVVLLLTRRGTVSHHHRHTTNHYNSGQHEHTSRHHRRRHLDFQQNDDMSINAKQLSQSQVRTAGGIKTAGAEVYGKRRHHLKLHPSGGSGNYSVRQSGGFLKLHAPRLYHRQQDTLQKSTTENEGLITYHFNAPLEFFLRGFLSPIADTAVTRLETVIGHGSYDARLALLEENVSLIVSGLSLLPLPQFPKSTASAPHSMSPSDSSTTSKNTAPTISESTNVTHATSPVSSAAVSGGIVEKSVLGWLHLVLSLQQRLSRNLLVELQLSCLPPLVGPDPNGQFVNKTMTLLQPHPTLPVCAGVIADSQVVHTPQGTLVISLWKMGEPHVRAVGTLALWPLSTSGHYHTWGSNVSVSGGGVSAATTSHIDPASSSVARPATASVLETSSSSNRTGELPVLKESAGGVYSSSQPSISFPTGSTAKPSTASGTLLRPSNVPHNSLTTTANTLSDSLNNQQHQSMMLTYAEAGPIKDLTWNVVGDRLVTAHNKGWVSIWALRTERSARLAAPSAAQAPHNKVLHMGSNTGVNVPLGGTSAAQVKLPPTYTGLPVSVFKAHTTSCRFAGFLGTYPGADTLLVTSGRGLASTPVVFPVLSSTGAPIPTQAGVDQQQPSPAPGDASNNAYNGLMSNGVVSCGPDDGCVCVWDLGGGDRLGFPTLLMVDIKFEKGNYATHYAVWRARQCVLYCTRKGEIRMMSLRYPGVVCTIVNPVTANLLRNSIRRQQRPVTGGTAGGLGGQKDIQINDMYGPTTNTNLMLGSGMPGSNMTASGGGTQNSGNAGIFGREIVKLFLLEESQRIVTCYEDAMIRVWDISKLCSAYYTRTGLIEKRPSQRQLKIVDSMAENGFGRGRWDCVPLLWETPSPVHSHDTSKLSLAASLMGAVFNIAPSGGNPRSLLDAQMASAYHVVTLGADGTVVMTRV